MPSMPCAKTSGMPARRAKSISIWIGFRSPDAPAKAPSMVRSIAGRRISGSESPTLTALELVLICSVPHDEDRGHLDHGFATLIGDSRAMRDDLHLSAFLVDDVGDLRFQR